MRPKCLTASATILSHCSGSRTSTSASSHLPPALRISSRTRSRFSTLRLATSTGAPRSANSFAIDSPIPVPPPVTIVTLPSTLNGFFKVKISSEGVRSDLSHCCGALARGGRDGNHQKEVRLASGGSASRGVQGGETILESGYRHLRAMPAAALAHMLGARRNLEPQMRRRSGRLDIAMQLMLPGQHPAPQHIRVDPERVAHGVEAERMAIRGPRRYPSRRIDKEQALARIPRQHALLIDVNRVGQQCEHQALFTGQAMAAGDVVILARKNLVQADEAFDRNLRTLLEPFRHLPNLPGR